MIIKANSYLIIKLCNNKCLKIIIIPKIQFLINYNINLVRIKEKYCMKVTTKKIIVNFLLQVAKIRKIKNLLEKKKKINKKKEHNLQANNIIL